MRRRMLAVVLALCLALGMLPGTAWAAEGYADELDELTAESDTATTLLEGEIPTSGTCGEDVRWYFNASTQTLTLTGSGRTSYYGGFWFRPLAPWTALADQIKFIHVEGSITSLGGGLFGSCLSAVGIVLPKTLEYIEGDALPLGPNSALQWFITEDNGVKYLADSGVLYAKSETGSGYDLVYYPPALQYSSYTLRSDTTRIAGFGFYYNKYIKKVILNNKLSAIVDNVFEGCTALAEINIPSSVKELDGMNFFYCPSLVSVSLPEGMTRIDPSAFWECESLSRLDIPSTVQDFTCDWIPGDGWEFKTTDLSVYFYGSSAPKFDDSIVWCKMEPADGKVTIYYPSGATGWDEVQRQEDVSEAISSGMMEFQTWEPENWDPVQKYTVSYNLNGGTGTVPSPYAYEVGSTVFMTPEIPTRAGYTFAGWSDGTTIYQPNQGIAVLDRDIVLTAVWKENTPDPSQLPINQNNVFLKQNTTKTCTLAAATMMLRRCAILNGISDWSSITENAVRETAWSRGLKFSFSYRGMNVATQGIISAGYNTVSKKTAYFISMLDSHPEGIVIYDHGKPHAVLLTDYDKNTGTFYCADPATSAGRIPLVNCTIPGSTQSAVIDNIEQIWYITNSAKRKSVVSTSVTSDCPVEMSVSADGIILDSTGLTGEASNSYVTMTASGSGMDRTVTAVISGEHVFDIKLTGTDTGAMTVTIKQTYTDGTVETQTFSNVSITEDTSGTASITPQSTVILTLTDEETEEESYWAASPGEVAVGPSTDYDILPGEIVTPDTPTYPTYPTYPSKPSTPPSTSTAPTTPTTTPTTPTTPAEPEQPVQPAEPETPAEEPLPFTDVAKDAYYYDAVRWAVAQGITTGAAATTFAPGEPCTRGQVVTFLWRAAGSPSPQGSGSPFLDVKPGAYYYDAVLWAVEQGITSGTSATAFSPDETVTRGQTAAFLYRAAGSPAVSGSNPFADVDSGAYYADAVRWAAAQGIASGTSDTMFSPDDACTRAHIVTFLYRAEQALRA